MSVVTAAMKEQRLHGIKESHGVHDLKPLFDAAVVSPDDLLACRECGLVVVMETASDRIPHYLTPWIAELIANDFGMVLPQDSTGWSRFTESQL